MLMRTGLQLRRYLKSAFSSGKVAVNLSSSLNAGTFHLALILLAALIVLDAEAASPPVINSFNPAFGPVGTVVTITGQNFSAAVSNNVIYFGAVRATALAAATNSLTVTVPFGATAPLTVTTSNLTAASEFPFIVTFNSAQAVATNSFEPRVNFGAPLNPYGLVIGDWDGDGKPDLATIGAGVAKLSLFRNTSTGAVINATSFGTKVDFATGGTPRGVAFADLDGDGKLDLVTANNGPDTVSVFRNISTNGGINTSSFAARADFGVGNAPYAIAIKDLDGDGKPDLVTANGNGDSISILRNTTTNGVISFAPKVDLSVGNNPRKVALADLDGDCKPEILAVNTSSGTLSILQNQSTNSVINTNSFGTKVDFPIASAWDVDVGDLDGDGKLDVVVSGGTEHTMSVLRNLISDGVITTNSFAPRVDFTVGSGSGDQGEAEIIDLDGDGKPDLVAVSKASDAVYVFRNVSTPGDFTTNSFTPSIVFSGGNGTYAVASADLDGDSRPDIVVTDLNSDNIAVLKSAVPIIPIAITSFTPTQAMGGMAITVFGTNLNRAMGVRLNGNRLDFSVTSSTQLSFTLPFCGASSGPIGIETLGGIITSSNAFDVLMSPIVSGTNGFNLEAARCGGGLVTFAVDGIITVTNAQVISLDTTLDGTEHNVTISGGDAVGVFRVNSGVHLTLKNLTIVNGQAVGRGGGIYNDGGIVTVTDCTFSNNQTIGNTSYSTGAGGALCNSSPAFSSPATLIVNNCTFVNNRAVGATGTTPGTPGQVGGNGGSGEGGAIWNNGYLAITNTTLYNNQAIGGAGGRGGQGFDGYTYQYQCGSYCCDPGPFGCNQHCAIYCTGTVYGGPGGNGGNGGDGYGGDIYDASDATIVNATFASGLATGGPGGLAGGNGTYNISGSGSPGANGSGAGGNIYEETGWPLFKNTIVANSTAGGNFAGNGITDAGSNLSSDATLPFTITSNFTNTNPNLGPLANNGGTTLTMALLPGSPAVRAGTPNGAPSADQRGQLRKSLQIDIGAYESPVTPSGIQSRLAATKPAEAGPFELMFTNTPGASFSIWSSTNVTLPFVNWVFSGFAREIAPGQFQFNDKAAANAPQSFYRVSSP